MHSNELITKVGKLLALILYFSLSIYIYIYIYIYKYIFSVLIDYIKVCLHYSMSI
jgi:hypothetical protein